jgi:hypothetical protein
MAESRLRNGFLKAKERQRRDARMRETVKKGKLPFTPPIMSWLSAQLNKPSSKLTQADVDRLLKPAKPAKSPANAGAKTSG